MQQSINQEYQFKSPSLQKNSVSSHTPHNQKNLPIIYHSPNNHNRTPSKSSINSGRLINGPQYSTRQQVLPSNKQSNIEEAKQFNCLQGQQYYHEQIQNRTAEINSNKLRHDRGSMQVIPNENIQKKPRKSQENLRIVSNPIVANPQYFRIQQPQFPNSNYNIRSMSVQPISSSKSIPIEQSKNWEHQYRQLSMLLKEQITKNQTLEENLKRQQVETRKQESKIVSLQQQNLMFREQLRREREKNLRVVEHMQQNFDEIIKKYKQQTLQQCRLLLSRYHLQRNNS